MEKLATKKIGNWEISYCWNPMSDIKFFRVSDGWHVDYPIIYSDQRIVYDYPELIPDVVKKAIPRFMMKHSQ